MCLQHGDFNHKQYLAMISTPDQMMPHPGSVMSSGNRHIRNKLLVSDFGHVRRPSEFFLRPVLLQPFPTAESNGRAATSTDTTPVAAARPRYRLDKKFELKYLDLVPIKIKSIINLNLNILD